MKRLAIAAALLGTLAFSTDAQATTPMPAYTATFVAVDGVRVEANKLYITGILTGEPSAQEYEFYFDIDYASAQISYDLRTSCERLALVAMSRPGQYTFEIASGGGSPMAACRLKRVSP